MPGEAPGIFPFNLDDPYRKNDLPQKRPKYNPMGCQRECTFYVFQNHGEDKLAFEVYLPMTCRSKESI